MPGITSKPQLTIAVGGIDPGRSCRSSTHVPWVAPSSTEGWFPPFCFTHCVRTVIMADVLGKELTCSVCL